MEINTERLAKYIKQEAKEMVGGIYCETRFCFGEQDGMQYHIVITKDEDEFIDTMTEEENCIST
jgi:hypothetical protein